MRSSHLEKQNRGVKFLELVQISTKNFTVEKLLQAKLELHKEGFLIGVED